MKRIIPLAVLSRTCAVGQAHVVRPATATRHYWITREAIDTEIARLLAACDGVRDELLMIHSHVGEHLAEERAILEVHILLAEDVLLRDTTIDHIRSSLICAEWALQKTLEQLGGALASSSDAYLQARRQDFEQVGQQILQHLANLTSAPTMTLPYPHTVLVANDISPAQLLSLPRAQFAGLITAKGGAVSHTAIVARALHIPAALGVGDLIRDIPDATWLLLDGEQQQLTINPSPAVRRAVQKSAAQHRAAPRTTPDARIATRDGRVITLHTNVSLLDEWPLAQAGGAHGVGLFRTELLFVQRAVLPTEEEQYVAYRDLLAACAPAPVTIRLLDLGADKVLAGSARIHEANPALGLRGLRFLLATPDIARAQLCAIVRAAPAGNVRVLLPMVTSVAEVEAFHRVWRNVQLEVASSPRHVQKIPIGMMVEVPSAALCIDDFLPHIDFCSIGSNDLAQYVLAADRGNAYVSHLYDAGHPAVLQLIARVVTRAKAARKPVTVCGEMAGDPAAIPLLIGLGVDTLSMAVDALAGARSAIARCTYRTAERHITRLLNNTRGKPRD